MGTRMKFAESLTAEIERNVATTLTEDIGQGDLTAQLIPASHIAQAQVIARERAVLCGAAWFERCFKQLDPQAEIIWQAKDGDDIAADQLLCTITGKARALLSAERSALNFLQLLSGVASKTRQYVNAIAGTPAHIVDTRKTIPGLRLAQKYAVHCGGGTNHRFGLYDAILIKENHILAAGSIANALAAAQQAGPCAFVQIEVETLDELQQALDAGATMILLDNMSLETMRAAVKINAGRAVLEASGNVNLDTVRGIAETGVDRISIGGLTKDVQAVDLSMRLGMEAAPRVT